MEEMKSEKIIALVKGVWAFCSFLFVPRWGRKKTAINCEERTED